MGVVEGFEFNVGEAAAPREEDMASGCIVARGSLLIVVV
jgi:hypothetical protein